MGRLAMLLAVPVLLATACSGGGLPDGVEVKGKLGRQPTVTIPKKDPPKGEFSVKTLHKGKGDRVIDGDLVVANYVGYRWGNGSHRLIATSFATGHPARFPYGRLVTGLNKALSGQRVGSRVAAVIPPDQGYGASGYAPLQIGGSDSLVFVLDLIGTYHNSATARGQAQPQTDPRMPQVSAGATPTVKVPGGRPPSTLQVKTIIKGGGPPVNKQQVVVFHDVGVLWRGGRVFESTRNNGRPDSAIVGAKQMLAGWDRAVVGQPVGSRVLVVIPPKYGYGAKGHPSSGIKGDDTLVFVIDILAAY